MSNISSISGDAAYQFEGLKEASNDNVSVKIEFSSWTDKIRGFFSCIGKVLGFKCSGIAGKKTFTLTAKQVGKTDQEGFDKNKQSYHNNDNQKPTPNTFTFTIDTSKYSKEEAQEIINLHTQAFSLRNKINSDPGNASFEDINQLYNVCDELSQKKDSNKFNILDRINFTINHIININTENINENLNANTINQVSKFAQFIDNENTNKKFKYDMQANIRNLTWDVIETFLYTNFLQKVNTQELSHVLIEFINLHITVNTLEKSEKLRDFNNVIDIINRGIKQFCNKVEENPTEYPNALNDLKTIQNKLEKLGYHNDDIEEKINAASIAIKNPIGNSINATIFNQ